MALQCLFVAPKGEGNGYKEGLRMIKLCNLLYEKLIAICTTAIQVECHKTGILLSCGNDLLSCGNDFVTCEKD